VTGQERVGGQRREHVEGRTIALRIAVERVGHPLRAAFAREHIEGGYRIAGDDNTLLLEHERDVAFGVTRRGDRPRAARQIEDVPGVKRPDVLQPLRLRALIVLLWRGGLRIQEALTLTENELDPRRGSILVATARATRAGRSGWTPGPGAIISLRGSPVVLSCLSARCSA
jgi:integrase